MTFDNLPGAIIVIAATILLPCVVVGFTLWRNGANPPQE